MGEMVRASAWGNETASRQLAALLNLFAPPFIGIEKPIRAEERRHCGSDALLCQFSRQVFSTLSHCSGFGAAASAIEKKDGASPVPSAAFPCGIFMPHAYYETASLCSGIGQPVGKRIGA